jgi:hypothetical protein
MNQVAGVYQIYTGFWPGGEGQRLRVVGAGQEGGDNRVWLGRIGVK